MHRGCGRPVFIARVCGFHALQGYYERERSTHPVERGPKRVRVPAVPGARRAPADA